MSSPDASTLSETEPRAHASEVRREQQVEPCGEWCRYFSQPFGDRWRPYGSCTHPRIVRHSQPLRPGRDCWLFEPRSA